MRLRLAGCRAASACALALLAATGCRSGGDVAGATTGTATAIATGSPALGAAVGLGTRALVDGTVRLAARRWRQVEQDALAAEVGGMEVGEARAWRARYDLPFTGEGGEVRVVRVAETALATCKEALFTVSVADEHRNDTVPRRWFLTSACREAEGWKWATAEPATERWSSLQ